VLTGTDGLSAGIAQGLWLKLLPNLDSKFQSLQQNYLPPAADMQDQAQGQGILVTYYPSGPLLEYDPKRVSDPPRSAQDLLAWAKAHPGRFMYAQPANSGPGRTFLMGLPYLLGDKDPRDPVNGWDKTWAYLKELGKYVPYYPSGTKDTMSALADGSRDIIASTTGWDINPRALGTVPKDVEVTGLDGMHWVTDAHYMVVPKGISEDKLAVVLDLMSYLLKPEQQALAYDDGYFYPGPAIKDVGIDMAPEKSQQVVEEYGRPEYEDMIASHPKETPLIGDTLVKAFDKWDREIGGSKVKE
jgi:putative spermidine/putrescine transport system substrate-binding protein